MRAKRTIRSALRAHGNLLRPLVVWTLATLPVDHVLAVPANLARAERTISRRVPLTCNARLHGRETVGHRQSTTRAEGTVLAERHPMPYRHFPLVVRSRGALPPDHPRRAGKHGIRTEKSVLRRVPLSCE